MIAVVALCGPLGGCKKDFDDPPAVQEAVARLATQQEPDQADGLVAHDASTVISCDVDSRLFPPNAEDIQALGCGADNDYAFAYFTLDGEKFLISQSTGTNNAQITHIGPASNADVDRTFTK